MRPKNRGVVAGISLCIAGLLSCVMFLPATAEAQNRIRTSSSGSKSAMVVSLAPVDKIMADIQYATATAGVPQFAAVAQLLTSPYLEGLNTKQPVGVMVNFNGTAPAVVAFLPVSDFERVIGVLKQHVGEPEAIGNGMYKLFANRELFLKERNGWAFVTDKQANLVDLPTNPIDELGNLPESYDIAVRVNVQNIPQTLRDTALSELKAGFERKLQEELRNADNREIQEKFSRSALKSLTSLIEDSDQLTIGWNIDAAAKSTYLDTTLTAISGTDLARQMAAQNQLKSAFSGFSLPGSAATLNFASVLTPDDIEQARGLVRSIREIAAKEIDKDDDIDSPQAKSALKEAVGLVLDSMDKTVAEGRGDGGASLVLSPGSTKFIAGMHVADTASLENALRKLVDVAKNQPQFPPVAFDADRHGNIRFHTLVAPIPADEEEPRKIFGPELDVAVGIGDKAVYLAIGRDSRAALKAAIDASSASRSQEVLPLQLKLSLQAIFEFATSVDPNPVLVSATQQLKNSNGRDHVYFTAKPIPNGARYRLEIEDGIIAAGGQIGKRLQQRN